MLDGDLSVIDSGRPATDFRACMYQPSTVCHDSAPLIDYCKIPILDKYLGHRKSWILMSQIFLIFFIIILGKVNPQTNMMLFVAVASLLAFFSATQDICIDAYRIRILNLNEQGLGPKRKAPEVFWRQRIHLTDILCQAFNLQQ